MKKLKKDVFGFTGTLLTTGIGTAMVAGMPGGSVMTPAFNTMAGMMPIAGTAMMGGHALRLTRKLQPRKRRRR